ncbi:hypothetical protein J437_LFUL003661 [Ladona fulva]|uniref:Uncharacterized protein n=1 Tax=Ladona fulva TaxID=123851 RepID=A0A8K0K475_LADFU|nr:hypothetical protein J437_LFUL003661 [Ladona fulva]
MKFLVKDCDPATGQPDSEEGYDDEYILEDIEVSLSDHMRKVTKGNFASAWEETGAGLSADPPTQFEIEDTYSLSGNLEEAVKNIVRFMGMAPCERSDRVPEGRSAHTLLLSGIFRGGYEVLVRAKLALIGDGVTMQLTVRSTSHDVAELITLTVG